MESIYKLYMITIKKIKTRFAPSPTGDLHIGGLRVALYNYLFAKQNGGEFILRIEDTDQKRYSASSADSILMGLNWAGVDYDNKKEVIYQTLRIEIYQKYVKQLLEQGNAYYCFCSEERLEKMRAEQIAKKQAPRYDRHCLNLSKEEIEEKLKNGEPYVIRMKIPAGETFFNDLIHGKVKVNNYELDDQILIKSDGFPTYHIANIVDDHEMEISHVIRGDDWLPSTPKHIILYQMFGWEIPEFAHLPLILAPDKSKLSKRHGATSVLEFKKLGYLPEALINYIALLGWNPGTEQEIFSLQELIKEFSFEKVQKASAIFDINKLNWVNGEYLRKIDLNKLTELCLPFLESFFCHPHESEDLLSLWDSRFHGNDKMEYLKNIIALEQSRLKKISDIVEATRYFFETPQYEKELLKWRKADLKDVKEKLEFLLTELKKIPDENWTQGSLEQFIKGLIEAEKFDTGALLWPMRAALSGRQNSPSPFEIAEVLGKEESLRRIKNAIKKINT